MKAEPAKHWSTLELPVLSAGLDGNLMFGEVLRHIPFEIRRFYVIYGIQNQAVVRGQHAHKDLRQVLFCLHGTVKVSLNDGTETQTYLLDSPNKGIVMGPGVWREMSGMNDQTVILTVADREYSESDYIRKYDDFLHHIGKK